MNKVAIVTGGTRGIGEAISVALQEMGYTVAANYAGNDERSQASNGMSAIIKHVWTAARALARP